MSGEKKCDNCVNFSRCGVVAEFGEEIVRGTQRKQELAQVCFKYCCSCGCSARDFSLESAINRGNLDTCCTKYGSKTEFCDQHKFRDLTETDNL